MANPYHDAEGRFCSKGEMRSAIEQAAKAGDTKTYLALRADYEVNSGETYTNNPLAREMTKDIAKVWSDKPGETYPLSTKETSLLKAQLRKAYTLKEIERMGLKPDTPVHTCFVHNMDATFDYNDSDTQRVFTKGACGYLAYALREKTGLPITVFTTNADSSYWEGHAALKLNMTNT